MCIRDRRITERISAQLNVRPSQVAAVIALLDGGATLPFIARYSPGTCLLYTSRCV